MRPLRRGTYCKLRRMQYSYNTARTQKQINRQNSTNNLNSITRNVRSFEHRHIKDNVSIAQATSRPQQNKEASADPITTILQKMMNQMEQLQKEQEEFIKSIIDRLIKLEKQPSRCNNLDGLRILEWNASGLV